VDSIQQNTTGSNSSKCSYRPASMWNKPGRRFRGLRNRSDLAVLFKIFYEIMIELKG
jgi:hypothetical protein